MTIHDIVTIDSEILGGKPVFKNTRVPIESLFDHLEAGVLLDEFLDDFPTMTREQVVALLEITNMNPKKESAKKELPAGFKVNPDLDKKYAGRPLFQEQIDRANHILETAGLPNFDSWKK